MTFWHTSWPSFGAPRLVRSGRSQCSGRLFRCRGAFPHPGGLRPRLYWVAARGTRRPAGNRAHCACRWPPPRQGRWACSKSYPFWAPQWGCPWRVPPASIFGCVRCGGWRVWTRSLTRPVSRTVRRSTGDSAGAPGLFRVDTHTSSCGSEDASQDPVRVCLCLLFLAGSGGPASRARSGAPPLFLWPLCLSASLGPLQAGVAPVLVFCLPSPPPFCFFACAVFCPVVAFLRCRALSLPAGMYKKNINYLTCRPALVAVSWLACLVAHGVLELTPRTFHLQQKGGESIKGGARAVGEGTC